MGKHDLFNRQVSTGRDRLCRFVLWEEQISKYKNRKKLNWKSIKAKKINSSKLPTTQGVYAFVVKPEVAQIFYGGYILYIGQTEDQNFRTRFRQYFYEANREKPRGWVQRMLKFWPNMLFYYYAETTAEEATEVESKLISALLPPNNEQIPGRLASVKKEIYR